MEDKEEGFIKKTVIMLISTKVGDHWKDKDFCNFIEAKNGYLIIEEKQNVNPKLHD